MHRKRMHFLDILLCEKRYSNTGNSKEYMINYIGYEKTFSKIKREGFLEAL